MNITFNYYSFSPDTLKKQKARFLALANDKSVEARLRKYAAEQLAIIEEIEKK